MIKVLNKNIIIINKEDLPASTADRNDAFEWLVECYPHIKGKRVGVDDFLFSYLLNNPFTHSRDYAESPDGYERYYRVEWPQSPNYNEKKGEGYPAVQMILTSLGTAKEEQNRLGRVLVEKGEQNLHFIQEIYSDKTLAGMTIQYQMPEESNIDTVFLVASPNTQLLKRIESFLKNNKVKK